MSDLITVHIHYIPNKLQEISVNKHHSIKYALMNHFDLEDKFTLFKGSLLDSSFTFSKYGINNGDNIAIFDSNDNGLIKRELSLDQNHIVKSNKTLSSMSCRKDINSGMNGQKDLFFHKSHNDYIHVNNSNFSVIYDSIFGTGRNKVSENKLDSFDEKVDRFGYAEQLPVFWDNWKHSTR